MSGPQFMPFYIGDYLRDTQHLSAEQHGAYLLLLMACWTYGSLPDDDRQLASIAKLSWRKWLRFSSKFENFFAKKSDGLWHQKRIDLERQRAENIREVRSKSGSKGAAKRKQKASTRARTTATATATKKRLSKSEPHIRAPAREGGNGEDLEKSNEDPGARCARLARLRAPLGAKPDTLKANRKELLRQKLMRFADDRFAPAERKAAIAGLSGADPEHTDQWWLDTLDERMRAEQWSDR